MEPSKYQTEFWSFLKNSSRNVQLKAVAGSGKSYTIKVGARDHVPSNLSVFFGAFNKHIADALRTDLPKNVECATLNAFGWKVCRQNIRGIQLDARKTDNWLR